MTTNKTVKKQRRKDWHPADVIAALSKAGWTLSKLSVHHGYERTTLQKALRRRWPKGERLVAEAIGKTPEAIWPSRYSRSVTTDIKKNTPKNTQTKQDKKDAA